MQKILAFILLFAFLGQTFNQGWYYLGYVVQKNEYVKRCENKAFPQLHCNGKCQLMKKIEEQRKKEQGLPPELKLAAKGDVISSKSFFPVPVAPSIAIETNHFFDNKIGSPIDQASSFFHPPDIAA